MNTPVYNALGRIRRLAMFESYFVPEELFPQSNYGIYTPMYKERQGIIDFFSAGIDVTIYFCDRSGKPIPIPNSQSIGKVKFVSIPVEEPRLSDWLQDFIHFVPLKELEEPSQILYGVIATGAEPSRFRESQCEKIATTESYTYQRLDEICAGGNVQRGYHGGKDYLVVGSAEHTNLPNHELERYFHIASGRVFRCALPPWSPYANEFYHLDLYLTLVGKLKNKISGYVRETVFLARAYGENSKEIGEELETVFDDFLTESDFFRPIKLPLIVLPASESEKGEYCLFSYNNCLIENYFEKDVQTINMYFPDFRNGMKQFAEAVFDEGSLLDKQSVKKAINKAIEQLQDLRGRHLIEPEMKSEESERTPEFEEVASDIERLIDICEASIKALKTDFAIDNIEFIDNGFAQLAKGFNGGLHCFVKVMHRDLVELK